MTDLLTSETVIPRMEGRAFEVRAGQVLRLIAIEGKQVGGVNDYAAKSLKVQIYGRPSVAPTHGRPVIAF